MEYGSHNISTIMKTALVLGASGLVGGELLRILIDDNRYEKVRLIGRKPLSINHPKIEQHTGNLFELTQFEEQFINVDDLFIAIGTTRAKTPDKKQYEAIDFGIPVNAGKMAADAGIKNVCVVSSMGANPTSSIFYSALKGRMEAEMMGLPLPNLNIVRPSLLLGNRNEKRALEKLSMQLMTSMAFLIPKKHRAINAADVARAMVVLANTNHSKHIWSNWELMLLALQYQ